MSSLQTQFLRRQAERDVAALWCELSRRVDRGDSLGAIRSCNDALREAMANAEGRPSEVAILCRAVVDLGQNMPFTPGASPDTRRGEIQWMPPGTHEITATQGDKTVIRKIHVDAAAAERLQTLLQSFRNQAAAGTEDLPFLDFNHDDAEASARVLEFKWGGEDPVTGGIRAVVEWTAAGLQALLGGLYRRFSPAFFAGPDGRITGAPVNMGGLVNRAAFKTIQPVIP